MALPDGLLQLLDTQHNLEQVVNYSGTLDMGFLDSSHSFCNLALFHIKP